MSEIRPSVLVVGAAGGIGFAAATLLARKGYEILGLDKVPSPDDRVFRHCFHVDLLKWKEIDAVYRSLRDEYPKLWGLVHCAGVYPIVPFSEYTMDVWEEVQNVNLRSVFQMAQQLSPHIHKGGRIVIVASGAAHLGSRDVGYSSSKAGVLGLVRSLSKTLAPLGILVNAVSPGVIKTQMSEKMNPSHRYEYLQRIPLAREGTPEEVAICIAFLLVQENSYMTGATLDVNGGLYAR
ncbi:MAG: SDR family oxidoreductase [Nitrososphaera sp.]|nr:SDR family oxidoreductase [Nitrososphaera sp.]